MASRNISIAAAGLCVALAGSSATAQSDNVPVLGSPSRQLHADIEVDPIAYALAGYSVHAGIGWQHWRVDLGAFALSVPEFVHGSPDFEVSFDGYGLKLQYFPFEEQSGWFIGADGGVQRGLVELQGSELARRDVQLSAGVHVGYRVELGAGFYVTPWLTATYRFGSDDVTLGGRTFDNQPFTVLPLVHLGYHLR